ncbi:hypothetical protein BsWGS_03169 [Bradybaena similaris]
MASRLDLCRCLIILLFHCLHLVVSEATAQPRTPETYYAEVSSTARLPCLSASPGATLRWSTKRVDRSLRSRTNSFVDKSDPDLLVNEIKDVRLSDAGEFICSDGRQSSTTHLVVFEPLPVRNVEADFDVPDKLTVTWQAPAEHSDLLRGYTVYVSAVGSREKNLIKEVNDIQPDMEFKHRLRDVTPGTSYEIEVAPRYVRGADEVGGEVFHGPKSQTVTVNTAKSEPAPFNVKAEPWFNSTILVTWEPPHDVGRAGVDGYIVHYKGIGKTDLPSGEVTVTRPDASNGWRAVLKGLKTKVKYQIHVLPFSGGAKKVPGQKSADVMVTHEGFNPELSVRAIPVSPDTVLVTVDTVGGDKVDKLRILYSDQSAVKWTRIEDYNSKEKYAVVTGLQPRTRYYFNVKAAVNKKARSVVTHVLTPPVDFPPATNISVVAATESSILITWSYDEHVPVKGFIVLIENVQPDGSVSPAKQKVVFKQNEAVVDGLDSGEKYQVKVEPFDLESIGTCSDSVLFQFNVAETTPPASERRAPEFVDTPPKAVYINAGDEVRLACSAIGSPHPVVRWFKDSAPQGEPVDRFNEIVLPNVKESTVLTCWAVNDVDFISSKTEVIVAWQMEPQAPTFNENLPAILFVELGGEVRQRCSASGSPVPYIIWSRNGVPRLHNRGSAEYIETEVSRHFDIKCEARNDLKSIEAVTKVYIKELLRAPTLSSQLPRIVEVEEGEQLSLPCSFDGDPTPDVFWVGRDGVMTEVLPAENNLTIESVKRSTYLKCMGENLQGQTYQTVALRVIPKGKANTSDYKLVLKVIQQSPTEVRAKWSVNEGDLDDIRFFDVKLLSDTGRILINQRRKPNQRSETFKRLPPNTRFTVSVMTTSLNGVVDNSSVDFTTAASPTSNRKPVLSFDITEVRDVTAMLDFTVQNPPRQLDRYRLRVKDLEGRTQIGNTILDRTDFQPDTPIVLENLKPDRNYQVIIDALSGTGAELLTANANFRTASHWQYGTSVSASSDTPPQLPTTQTSSTSPTLTPSTVVATTAKLITPRRTLPTTASTETTSTMLWQTSPTATTTEDPENHDYDMTTKIAKKSPYSVDIKWTVDRGPLENIKNFTLIIKGERGNILLQQDLGDNQRYITIQSLNPNTRYFVTVRARGEQGVLAESEVAFQTDPDDTPPDTSNPVLELEANEVRPESTRIDWTAVNTAPDFVASYRLRVLDTGPEGFNLLTQKMEPSSQSLSLQQLQPNQRYHVILEALASDDSVLMTSSLTFKTPSVNRYGKPVSASSRAKLQPEKLTKHEAPVEPVRAHPVLEFWIDPISTASSQLTWSTQNVPGGQIAGYALKIRRNGPQGDIILKETLSEYEASFRVDGLVRDRHYFLELDAINQSGTVVLTASTLYTPDSSLTRVHAISKPSDGALTEPQSREGGSQVDDSDSKPEIDLELNPSGHNQVKVNWTVLNENRRRPIAAYKITVRQDGPEGHKMLEDQVPRNTAFYTVYELLQDIRYYIHLDALDSAGRVIENVGYPYLVPPPGHAVEPIRTSSVFNKKTAATTVSPQKTDTLPERDEPVITSAVPQGANTILVEWDFGPTDPPQETIVRYSELVGNVRGPYKIEYDVPAGQKKHVIRNLKPDTTYGIQVAARGRGAYHVRWSKIVLRKTNKV